MAKSAILSVLEDTIGRYVEGLDAKSLNVAVWAGKIQLQSLKLDVPAVNRELARQAAEAPNLAIPFRIVEGSFESLEVDVPWARITSKPVVLRAKGLEVTIEPFDHLNVHANSHSVGVGVGAGAGAGVTNKHEGEGDSPKKKKARGGSHNTSEKGGAQLPSEYSSEAMNEKRMSDERLQALELAEEARIRMNTIRQLGDLDEDDDPDAYMSSSFSVSDATATDKADQLRNSASSTGGFKARLVRRVIENLQLEIEDINFQLKGAGCDIGASIEKFSIFTTDILGKKSFIDRATNSKNVLKSFLYKALELEGLAVYCDEDKRIRVQPAYLAQPYQPMDLSDRHGKTYILEPLSFSAKLRQSDCITCIDFPKYLLSAELPTVSFRLTRTQLELMHRIGNEINEKKHVARPLFPEYRPDVPISKKTAKLWWKYAVRSIGRISRRRSWTEFYIAYRKRKVYIDFYKRLLYSAECSWLKPVTISDRGEMDQIERDKSISTQGVMAWRNIADAQVHLEMKKYEEREETKRSARRDMPSKKKATFRSMMFGKKEDDRADRSLLGMDMDDPPIVLSTAEMRELDSLALESATAEVALSSDSILCDVSFEMGSFHVELVTFASAPLVSLEMGKVLSFFKANADGSFSSTFSLSSLDVRDRITHNTLFPVVIRSLQSSEQDPNFETFKNAVEIKLSKAKNGDQHLEAKMVSYEIVACDVLIKELKRFATIGKEKEGSTGISRKALRVNPMLQYSATGGADLFYDASEQFGNSTVLASAILQDIDELATSLAIQTSSKESSKVRDKFSSAFADAWKSKLEKETVWSVKIDLHAPILVLPKSCTDPLATTLVVDLGTFQMTYGKTLSPSVHEWFCGGADSMHSDMKIDHCSLEMEHFSLVLSKAGKKDWLQARNADTPKTMESESIIDPVTLKLDIGLENGGKERKCMFGNLEQISLTISHSQVVKAVSLLSFWSNTLQSLSGENDSRIGVDIMEDDRETQSLSSPSAKAKEFSTLKLQRKVVKDYDVMHFSLTLQEFKAKIVNEKNESVEAYLLSATASSTKCSDDSSFLHLQMGHFWILDHLKGDFRRNQRLVVHSLLPRPPSEYAKGHEYNLLESFLCGDENDNDITSLADIKIRKSSLGQNGMMMDNPFSLEDKEIPMTTIDAKFSTLYLHWNPYAIKNLLAFQKDLLSLMESVKSIPIRNQRGSSVAETIVDIPVEETFLVLNAQMEAFEVCLNSAKDDLPLFGMTMANTSVYLHFHKALEDSMMASVAVGDFRLQALPTANKISPEYRTILGLSPNHSSSLLQLQYGKGSRALRCCPLDNFDTKVNEMFMVVNLSPMRFVHCHAVVFTLMEYVTEGVLGALAEKVAESAAQAARQISQNEAVGNKVISVNAQGFDFVLPQAAYSPNYFILKAGDLNLDFISFPEPGEGKASIRLNKVTMQCDQGENIIDDPIVLDVNILLAPMSSPSPHEMATQIDLKISRVALLLTRNHYSQAMNTLDCNISEDDTYLREENQLERKLRRDADESFRSTSVKRLTHGGVEEVDIKKRMYMTFKFEAVCLDMCRESANEPLISIAALESDILLRLLPDMDQIEATATMLDLVVVDSRIEAIGRYFKNIVQQVNQDNAEHDVFSVTYCKAKSTNVTKIEVEFGSPRITFIPDALSDALSFFDVQKPPPTTIEFDLAQQTKVQVLGDTNTSSSTQQDLKTLDFTLKTGDCSFALIDMGAISGSHSQQSGFPTVDGETVVLKGRTTISAKKVSNLGNGEIVELECQVHGDEFEMYSAQGPFLSDPVQILSPTKLSFFVSTKNKADRSSTDIAFVSLADFNIILSIRQYALLMAIASSTTDCFSRDADDDTLSMEEALTDKETDRIKKLGEALAKNDDDASGVELVMSRHSSSIGQSSHGTKNKKFKERVFKMKSTLPNTNITVINDLQGVDEALFKITISSFLNNTEVCFKVNKTDTIFHSHTYLLINADYFDAHSKRWERLLLKPWELDFKAVRGQKKNTARKAATVDIESHACELSFSEQFIISLKSASAMWSVYSGANNKALALIEEMGSFAEGNTRFLKSRASFAARALTTTLPYGLSNRSGLPVTYVTTDYTSVVNDSSTDFFHFPRSSGEGVGGYRLYGQYAKEKKTISIIIADQQISFKHIDDEVVKGKRVHQLGDGLYIFTEVKKTGKALILYISSFMDIYNHTSLDFYTSMMINNDVSDLGTNLGDKSFSQHSRFHRRDMRRIFGVNLKLLEEAYGASSNNRIWLVISPTKDSNLVGELELPPFAAFRQMTTRKKSSKTVEVVCSPRQGMKGHSITVSLECKVSLIEGHPHVELNIRPRLIVRNNLFVNLLVTTPMQGTCSKSMVRNEDKGTSVHSVSPFDVIEVFHAGSSVAFAFKCADIPIGGNRTGWNKLGWIDIPLTLKSRLKENIHCSFPFLTASGEASKFAGGCDFFLVEEGDGISESDISSDCIDSGTRTISLYVNNLGVDHTGDILFESWDKNQQYASLDISETTGRQNFTFSSFSSSLHKRRITILPKADSFLRVIHLSMDGIEGFRRSEPFCIDEVAFCEGGVESSPILWEDSTESGYFAYRKFSSSNQSEIHVIPEFVVFNGGDSKVRITVQRCSASVVEKGKMAIAKRPASGEGLILSIMFDELKCTSAPIRADELGLKVVLVRSCKSGSPVGSLAIQTVLGAKDSRFVIKLGALKHGNSVQKKEKSLIHKDYLHFRIRWSQLEVTLLDTSKAIVSETGEPPDASLAPQNGTSYQRVAHFVLERFTLDYQKLFKETAKVDAARTQFSAIIFNIHVSDCTKSEETTFLSSVSDEHNFLDMRVRTRGSGDSGLAKIDHLELKIAHCGKKASKVVINTNEDFIWDLLDIASRTNTAISEFTSTDTAVEWDDGTQAFQVSAVDIDYDNDDDIDDDGMYRAPRSDMLFAVKKMYVWPSAFLVSFKRSPNAARYEKVQNVQSAKIVAYFMKQLNFTVSKAHLRFAGFSCDNTKGPPDRFIQSVKAFYLGQMKKKLFTLLTSTSIDEWRQLSGRDDGKDSYVEGDILRTTGNLAGRSAGFVVKKFGQGIGQGFAAGTAEVGNGIQSASEAIGAGAFGAGVNSLVSGIGQGVGNTVEGVGAGGNKLIKGAGKGVGQIVGGVGGGLQQVAMGIGKGVTTGDGNAIFTGIGDGVTSIGTGVIKGTESVVTGAAEGVFSIGKGLFTGVSSLGKGVGRAIQGKQPKKKDDPRKPPSGRHNRG